MFIIIITSFFWAPLLEHKIATNYEVFKPGRMERTDVLISFKLNFIELFITPSNSSMIYEIGLLSIILLVLSPIVIQKLINKYKNTDFYKFYIFSILMGLVSIIMTLKIFPFEHLPSILKMLQFSFRMLEFSSFFFAFVVAVNLSSLIKKVKYKDIILLVILLTLLSSVFVSHLYYTDNLDEKRLWDGVKVTSKTGRVHAGCASFEYLPSKAFENRHYIETRNNEVIILEGNAQIKEQNKENTNLTCIILNAKEAAKLELPYIYYLGYEVTLEQNGEKTKLKTYETENGFIGVEIPSITEGKLEVHYEGTNIMKVSALVSVLGLIILLMLQFRILYKLPLP